MTDLARRIEQAFEGRTQLAPKNVDDKLRADVDVAIAMLDSGEARVAEKIDGDWVVHEWLKKAVLLSFRIYGSEVVEGAFTR